tara:strand:+ start:668 stop:829 length:162 start_codon:yes stop_codon:yes gene_type:complete
MQNKTPNETNTSFSEAIEEENQNIKCKDGFCFIPNLEEKESINNKNLNIFDPI